MIYTADVMYDEGSEEYYIHIPPEVQENLGWEEGDVLDYKIHDEGILIKKISL